MAIVYIGNAGGGSGGGVQDVTAADTSIVVAGTAAHPTVRTGTLDVIATDHPAAADWSNNSHKITSLANGSAASDALAYGQVFATGAVPVADIADPGSGKVIGSSGGQAAAVNPPGFEIGYTQITTSVNITDTLETTGTALISPGTLTFDGEPVILALYCYTLIAPTNAFVAITLFEGATEITRLAVFNGLGVANSKVSQSLYAEYRFTPSAGSHTYKICGFVANTTGTPQILAGAGGAGAAAPSWVRFVKA